MADEALCFPLMKTADNFMEHDSPGGPQHNTFQMALQRIRLFATDVDGVLTDGGMYYGDQGQEWKKFHAHDGMGLKLLQGEGLVTAFITAEQTQLVALRAAKLDVREIHQGVQDKLAVLQSLANQYHLSLTEVAYMGDDVNDLPALSAVGFAACPANAVPQVRHRAHYVCRLKGGDGALREVADLLLVARRQKSHQPT